MQDTAVVQCPYCWQANEIEIDASGGTVQSYVEDCQVCCQPWRVTVELRGKVPLVSLERA